MTNDDKLYFSILDEIVRIRGKGDIPKYIAMSIDFYQELLNESSYVNSHNLNIGSMIDGYFPCCGYPVSIEANVDGFEIHLQ
ncbi:hypothetical protein ACM66T_10020 [Sulfurimonas sp. ST-25]|uniref:hypothetical protein n=1 Tax=Sulfurimonas sp. ST-25 TaxID=3400151 RepID=UPI003A83DD87